MAYSIYDLFLILYRQWIYGEIKDHLMSELPTNRGVIIMGSPGTGKTALLLRLVETSCFGSGKSEPIYQGISTFIIRHKITF